MERIQLAGRQRSRALGAVRCLTDPTVRDDNERYLEEAFRGSDRFAILMRVQVLGRRTVSPILRSPNTVLYSWPSAQQETKKE